MSVPGSRTAARAAVCVMLLAAAASLTFTHRDSNGAPHARERGPLRTAVVTPVSSRLDPGVHPAADPLFGALWLASHRLIMPVPGVDAADLIDTFAQRRGETRLHEGIDIPAPQGAPVVAVTDGMVLRLTQHDSGGITLYLLAPDGRTVFYYAHLSGYATGVRPGIAVRQGDVLGHVGDTGNAGPGNYHLHFEITTAPDAQHYWAGRPRNPYPLLKRARG